MPWTRRQACLGFGSLFAVRPGTPLAGDTVSAAQTRIGETESGLGGRVGVALRDTGSGQALLYRADEAFPLCSTFKMLAAAAILARVDAGTERLDRVMDYGRADLDAYAPVTGAALDAAGTGRMALGAVCAAAMVWSDNTAGNLMLTALGGSPALTAWLRGIGDPVSRLDRTEPDLNTAIPGDPRDTTRPAAMLADLQAILLGEVLSPAGRARLEGWMTAARTGGKRLRAGLPPDWRVGDKTGTGDNGTANVVAILRPPGRAPILAAIYMTGSDSTPAARDAAHAAIGRLVTETL